MSREKTYNRPTVLEIPADAAAPAPAPTAVPNRVSYTDSPGSSGSYGAPQASYTGGGYASNSYASPPVFSNAAPAFSVRPTHAPAATAPPVAAVNAALKRAEYTLMEAQSAVQDAHLQVERSAREVEAHDAVIENRRRALEAAILEHDKLKVKHEQSIGQLATADAAVVAAFAVIDELEDAQREKERQSMDAVIAQVALLEQQEREERESRELADAIAKVALAEQRELEEVTNALARARADEEERAVQADMQAAMEQALEAEMKAAMEASLAASPAQYVPVAVSVPATGPAPVPASVSVGPVTPAGSRWIQRKHESNNRKYWQNNVTGEKTYIDPTK